LNSQGKVTVKAYPDKGARHLVIKVVDQGVGIPRDKLLTIFEAFKQVRAFECGFTKVGDQPKFEQFAIMNKAAAFPGTSC